MHAFQRFKGLLQVYFAKDKVQRNTRDEQSDEEINLATPRILYFSSFDWIQAVKILLNQIPGYHK